jgi:N-succinyldiaminopimelate aminotransferase
MPTIANRVAGYATTIFTEINELALTHHAINLGQGRPDFDGPPEIAEALAQAAREGKGSQYAPSIGIAPLRDAISLHAQRFYGLDIDAQKGVIVTPGATVAVFTALMGLVDRGDEVIIVEPYFDSYLPNIEMIGATPVYVPLHPPNWVFDPDELKKAFTKKTRAIILNTPHNPTGRVFTREELQMIANLCIEHDVTVISDEVYEHLTFGSTPHIPIATLPGMLERTVTVSSFGKTFSYTGWKLGWIYGAPSLMTGVARAHQYITFTGNHPAQVAALTAFGLGGTYYEEFQHMYAQKRDLLMQGLSQAGLKARQPDGTYFVMADFSGVFDGDDLEFARYLTTEIGVACIPPTFFYSTDHAHMASTQARFAFCKSDDTLKEVAQRLSRLKG